MTEFNHAGVSFEDEAPATIGDRMAKLRGFGHPGKSREAVEPASGEYIGAVHSHQDGVVGKLDIKVYAIHGEIKVGPFSFNLVEAMTLACAIMDGCQWLAQAPERARLAMEVMHLERECEEAGL